MTWKCLLKCLKPVKFYQHAHNTTDSCSDIYLLCTITLLLLQIKIAQSDSTKLNTGISIPWSLDCSINTNTAISTQPVSKVWHLFGNRDGMQFRVAINHLCFMISVRNKCLLKFVIMAPCDDLHYKSCLEETKHCKLSRCWDEPHTFLTHSHTDMVVKSRPGIRQTDWWVTTEIGFLCREGPKDSVKPHTQKHKCGFGCTQVWKRHAQWNIHTDQYKQLLNNCLLAHKHLHKDNLSFSSFCSNSRNHTHTHFYPSFPTSPCSPIYCQSCLFKSNNNENPI